MKKFRPLLLFIITVGAITTSSTAFGQAKRNYCRNEIHGLGFLVSRNA